MRTICKLMDLSGRVAVVTGGAGNLGAAICETLAELGAEVCLIDMAADRAQARAEELSRRFGKRATAVGVDITHENEVERGVFEILDRYGRLDILINNAAYAPGDLPPDGFGIDEQNLAQWHAQLEVILTGAFLMIRTSAKHLAAHGNGTVINIASIYGLVGPDPSLYADTAMVNEAHYAAGKGGLLQLTRYCATMLAPTVRVNCIAPGGMRHNQTEVFHQRYRSRTPLGRMACEEDVKGAIAYLATDLSAYVTGQILSVDGGWTAW